MGEYAMSATAGVRGVFRDGGFTPDAEDGSEPRCQLSEVTAADFGFNVVLTRDSASTHAWVTLNGYSRDAGFDGQVLNSTAEASRVFQNCSGCRTRVVETMAVAVLSRSQIDAGAACPPNALDGGINQPNPDAGIFGPRQTETGFDALRLCGELTTLVVAESFGDGTCNPSCDGCMVRYQLRGDRR